MHAIRENADYSPAEDKLRARPSTTASVRPSLTVYLANRPTATTASTIPNKNAAIIAMMENASPAQVRGQTRARLCKIAIASHRCLRLHQSQNRNQHQHRSASLVKEPMNEPAEITVPAGNVNGFLVTYSGMDGGAIATAGLTFGGSRLIQALGTSPLAMSQHIMTSSESAITVWRSEPWAVEVVFSPSFFLWPSLDTSE